MVCTCGGGVETCGVCEGLFGFGEELGRLLQSMMGCAEWRLLFTTGNESRPVCVVESRTNVLPPLPEDEAKPLNRERGADQQSVASRRSFELVEASRNGRRFSVMTYFDAPADLGHKTKLPQPNMGISLMQLAWDHDICRPPPENRLVNSVSAAISIAKRVAGVYQISFSNAAAKAAINSLDLGCLIFDRRGQLVFANPIGRDLTLRDSATGKDMLLDAPEFQRELRGYLNDRSRPVARLSRSVSFRLPSGEIRPAYLMKLSSGQSQPDGDGSQLVALFAPTHRARPSDSALQIAFGLTPAEARVAARIACGTSIARTADELSLSIETTRSYSKTIFSKLGISRQSALAAHAAWVMIPTECGRDLESRPGRPAPRLNGAKAK